MEYQKLQHLITHQPLSFKGQYFSPTSAPLIFQAAHQLSGQSLLSRGLFHNGFKPHPELISSDQAYLFSQAHDSSFFAPKMNTKQQLFDQSGAFFSKAMSNKGCNNIMQDNREDIIRNYINSISNCQSTNIPQCAYNSNDNRTLNTSYGNSDNRNNNNNRNNNCELINNYAMILKTNDALFLDTPFKIGEVQHATSEKTSQQQSDDSFLSELDTLSKQLQFQLAKINASIMKFTKGESEVLSLPQYTANKSILAFFEQQIQVSLSQKFKILQRYDAIQTMKASFQKFRNACPSAPLSQFLTLFKDSQFLFLNSCFKTEEEQLQGDSLSDLSKKNPFKIIRSREVIDQSDTLIKSSNGTPSSSSNEQFIQQSSHFAGTKQEEVDIVSENELVEKEVFSQRGEFQLEDIEEAFADQHSTNSTVIKPILENKKMDKRLERLNENIVQIFENIEDACEKILPLSLSLCKEVANSSEVMKSRSYEGISAAIIVHASRMVGNPLTIKKMSKITDCKEKIINKVLIHLNKHVEAFKGRSEWTGQQLIGDIVQKLNLQNNNLLEISLFLNERSNFLNLAKNKHLPTVVVCLIKLAATFINLDLNVKVICDVAGVCQVSARQLYKTNVYPHRFELIGDHKILGIDFKKILASPQMNLD